jgi:hypothetical protein
VGRESCAHTRPRHGKEKMRKRRKGRDGKGWTESHLGVDDKISVFIPLDLACCAGGRVCGRIGTVTTSNY